MAFKCPLCKDPKIISIDPKNVAEHLIVTRDHDTHYHVHGPVRNKVLMQDFVINILKEAGIAYNIEADQQPAERVPEGDKED